MALIPLFDDRDDFIGTSGSNLSAHLTNGGLSWIDLGEETMNRFIISPSGFARNNDVSPHWAVARVNMTVGQLPAGISFDKPRYLMTMVGRTALVSVNDQVAVGIYMIGIASFFGGGWATVLANQESGQAVSGLLAPYTAKAIHGGTFSRFPSEGPMGKLEVLAGGSATDFFLINTGTAVVKILLYIDEYQMIFHFQHSQVGSERLQEYAVYPRELRTLRAFPLGFAGAEIVPVIFMRSNDVTANASRIDFLEWVFFGFTPRTVLLEWQPIEHFFVARQDLDFQSLRTCTQTIIGPPFACDDGNIATSEGPYIMYPPTRYRDVEVTAAMLILDNHLNPAFIDVEIGVLMYSIAPFSRFQLYLPTISAPIKVSGGGNKAVLYLLSEVIAYTFE